MKCPYCPTSVNAVTGSGKFDNKTNISESYWRCAEGHRFTRVRYIDWDKEEFKEEFVDMKFEPSLYQDWHRQQINRAYEEGRKDEKDT